MLLLLLLLPLSKEEDHVIDSITGTAWNINTGEHRFIAKDCLFSGRSTDTQASAGKYTHEQAGGFILLNYNSGSNPSLEIDSCTFHSCYSQRHGAIAVINFPANAKTTIKSTCASDCYTTVDEFSFAYITGSTNATMFSITGCHCQASEGDDGVLSLSGASLFNNVNISDNYQSSTVVFLNDGASSFSSTHCQFSRNEVGWQVLAPRHYNVPMTVDSCNFLTNTVNTSQPTEIGVVYTKTDSTIRASIFRYNTGVAIRAQGSLHLVDCFVDDETQIVENSGSTIIKEDMRLEGYVNVNELLSTAYCPHTNLPARTYPEDFICDNLVSNSQRSVRTKVIFALAESSMLYEF